MQRLTARLLLLFALAGNLIPLALAATAAPVPACCRRMGPHRCNAPSQADSGQTSFHASSCCNHDCCRAVTTSQFAHPESSLTAVFSRNIEIHSADLYRADALAESLSSQSTRAPPRPFA
jgi:hypothetical protein